jgi:hypothetical protein
MSYELEELVAKVEVEIVKWGENMNKDKSWTKKEVKEFSNTFVNLFMNQSQRMPPSVY